jgi:LEA14-like dessication related protein
MRTKILAVALVLATLLIACTGLGTKLETPQVSFVGLKALEANLFEQRLEVRLLVKNPNQIALPVNGLDVDVELAGEPLAHGVSAREFTIPANGEAEFDMLVTANAATALIKILGSDRKSREAIEYRLKGKLSTHLGMWRSIPFDETGTLPIGSITDKKGRKTD